MTANTLPELPRYRHPAAGNASARGYPSHQEAGTGRSAPIIEADQTNEDLKMVARIRRHAGPDPADPSDPGILFWNW